MKTSPNLPPLPNHSAPRHHVARELVGLFLIGAGTVGLLWVTSTVTPLLTLFLIGAGLCTGALGTLFGSPSLGRTARALLGYLPLGIGLSLITFAAWLVSPWTLACALVTGGGVWLSSKEA
ncbi:hypothetical protein [Streptomyces sp. NPDC088915]|uniref:hypothetical protein n=1 Tax=Streptomyces sp. NPDC088915 TaxID=3365912 RepID=UPI0037FCE45E